MPFSLSYSTSEDGGTATMDGTEVTVKEVTSPKRVVQMYINLTNMQAGDTITFREYVKEVSGGSYVIYGTESFSEEQSIKMLHFTPMPSAYGIKVTAEQTAGVNRTLSWRATIEDRS